jgi:perosamine synthetase
MILEKRVVKFGKPIIGDEEKNAVMEVLGGDILVHGPKAVEFETGFSEFTGAPHSVSTSSCTASLHLSYFHYGIGVGDEVIVPAQSHVATVHTVELAGATPVFVDAELETGNIDIDQIESKITDKTKAITIVHYLGMPVAMDKICALADKYNLKVIEDCALAIGSYYKGIHAGLWGDTGSYSFYPVKHFTTAEGGMLITKHKSVAEKITRQKAFGVERAHFERKVPGVYDVNMLGFNYRMNEMQAAIGVEQLKKIQGFLDVREKNYQALEKGLKEVEGISLFKSTHGDFKSSYYCLSILLDDDISKKRFELVKAINEEGVGTSVYYPKAIPEFTYYKEKYGYKDNQFPNAAKISNQTIALPVGPHLNQEDMAYIVQVVKNTLNKL